MKKSLYATLSAVVVAFGLAASAGAGPLTLSLSATSLPNRTTSDMTHQKGIGLTVGYDVPLPILQGLGAKTSLEASVLTNSGNGGHLKSAGLELVTRMHLGGAKMPYIGVGFGAANLQGKATTYYSGGEDVPAPLASSTVTSDHQVRGTARVLVGAKIDSNTFVEAAYLYRGKLNDVICDTYTFSLGVRF